MSVQRVQQFAAERETRSARFLRGESALKLCERGEGGGGARTTAFHVTPGEAMRSGQGGTGVHGARPLMRVSE